MLRESDFENFLTDEPTITSMKAIKSRLSKARKAEEILNEILDVIVADDCKTYDALVLLHSVEKAGTAPYSNAVRKYYKFINRKEFPRLRDFI